MGNILNPDNWNSFSKLVMKKSEGLFVDKTDFIGKTIELFNCERCFIAMTRPRRFGKTVTAQMLAAYYSCGCDSRELFKGLKITRYKPKNEQQQNSADAGQRDSDNFHGSGEDLTCYETKAEAEFKIESDASSGREEQTGDRCRDNANADHCMEKVAACGAYGAADDRAESSEESLYEKYLNKSNVIYWDMNAVQADFRDYLKENKDSDMDIVDFLRYQTVRELRKNQKFKKVLDDNEVGKFSLHGAFDALFQDLKATFVLIMDEWDLIYREYRDDEQLQKNFIDLLKDLFKSGSVSRCFSLVYLTGILPIKKYNSQSALNMFDEYNMMSPEPYEKYFGFTEEEVSQICRTFNSNISLTNLREWYEGYKLNNKDIYNPNSVVLAMSDGKCKSYWSGTSSNEEVVWLINKNFDGIKDDIVHLIEGCPVRFDMGSFQNDMVTIENKDQVFSLLVCFGYLGCSDAGENIRTAYVPNKEIRIALKTIVRSQKWFNSMSIIRRSEELFTAIKELDGENTARIVEEIHSTPNVSLLGYNSEEALVFTLIAGLMWSTDYEYECYRELQSGKGFVDLVYVPKTRQDLPVLIIEFKKDADALDAINQIKDRNYTGRYCRNDYYGNILFLGISYNSRTKKHQCLIEKFDGR
jgi:hypothetical protein